MFISTMNDASVIPARPRVEFHAHVVRTIRSAMGPEDLLLTAVGKPDGFKPPKIGPRAAKFHAGAEGRRAGQGDQYQIRRGIRFAHVMHVLVRS